MITVRYKRDMPHVSVRGHACCGEMGRDLLCAAVSTLACTLGENIRRFCALAPQCESEILLENGRAELSLTPCEGMAYTARLLFDALCMGFALLAEEYPENVKFTEEET